LQLQVLEASAEQDLDTAFAALADLRTAALVIGTDGFFDSQSGKLGAMAARLAIPAIYQTPEFTAAGGLMSYVASLPDAQVFLPCRQGDPAPPRSWPWRRRGDGHVDEREREALAVLERIARCRRALLRPEGAGMARAILLL